MWVSVREAAVIYKVAVRTIREWIKSGKVKSQKLDNGRLLVRIEESGADENKS